MTTNRESMRAAGASLARLLRRSAPLFAATTLAVPVRSQEPVRVDPYFGSGAVDYPLVVPPGTAGMQPKLSLTYSSALGESGLGRGWKISGLDAIELDTRAGTPRYDGHDTLTLSGEEIVDTLDGYFHTQVESHLRIRKLLQGADNAYWEVTQRDGTLLRFGFDPLAEVPQGLGASDTFRWHVDRIEDAHGNGLTVSYDDLGDAGVLYPAEVLYTQHDGVPVGPSRSVHFEWEARPDVSIDYSAGFRQERTHRLASIRTAVGGTPVRSYVLGYVQDAGSGRSLLASIREVGSDGTTALQPTRFAYGEPFDHFEAPVPWTGVEGNGWPGVEEYSLQWWDPGGDVTHVDLLDLNADGLPDRLRRSEIDPYTDWFVQLSSGSGFESTAYWPGVWSPSGSAAWCAPQMWSSGDQLVELLDMDGDGFPDRLLRGYTDPFAWSVQLGDGSGFGPPTAWTGVEAPGGAGWAGLRATSGGTTIATLVDMNGDRLPDRLLRGHADHEQWTIQRNTGDGFGPTQAWTGVETPQDDSAWSALHASNHGQGYVQLLDMNGDGLPDRLLRGYVDPAQWTVQFNHGAGFAPAEPWPGVWSHAPGNEDWCAPTYSDNGMLRAGLVDLTGDGLPDRVLSIPSTPSQWVVQVNTGAGFQAPFTWKGVWCPDPGDGFFCAPRAITGNGAVLKAGLFDLDGDGSLDRVVRTDDLPSSQWHFQRSAFRPTALLREITLPAGGTFSLEYGPATAFDNTGGDGVTDLPLPIPVVTRLKKADGLGSAWSWTYSYSGGVWNREHREFRGFARALVTGPDGDETELRYLQDDVFKGRQVGSVRRAPDGAALTQEDNEWSGGSLLPGVDVVQLVGATRTTFDGDATATVTRTEYSYDDFGNVLEERRLGDPVDPEDDRAVVRTYAVNTSDWILSTPASEELRDALWNVASRTELYYDDSSVLGAPPTRGALTEQREVLASGAAVTSFGYDAHGNVVATTDAEGRTTTVEVDPVFATFPVRVEYPLGLVETYEHDPGTGLVLSSTDANGLRTTHQYDPLGRPVRTFGPDDQQLPGVEVVYDDAAFPRAEVTSVRRVRDSADPDDVLVTYAFFDGLGREVQVREPHADPAQHVVHDLQVDHAGRLLRRSHPYARPFSTAYTVPDLGRPAERAEYDCLGRQTRALHADGSEVRTDYDAPFVTRTDEAGERVRFEYDAFQDLVEVFEFHTGGGIGKTRYAYTARGELARVVDANGNVTDLEYDALGRRTRLVDPDVGTWLYEYDLVGNLVRRTDARGVVLDYAYDDLNRLLTTSYPDGGTVTSTYDAYPDGVTGGLYPVGRRTFVSDPSGSTTFGYDARGRVVLERKEIVGAGTYQVDRAFDALGDLVSVQYPDASVALYEHDRTGRVVRVRPAGGGADYVEAIEYDAAGQLERVRFGNGVETQYAYDPLSRRLASLRTLDPQGQALQDFAYQYDPVGDVLQIADATSGLDRPDLTQSFAYDALHRLTSATGHYGTLDFAYDLAGNVLQRGDATYQYGGAGVPANGIRAGTDFSATYDANGNMTRMPGVAFTYDFEGRLVRAKHAPKKGAGGGGTIGVHRARPPYEAEFVYDGDGGRVLKQDSRGARTVYVGDLYEERDGREWKHVFLGSQRIAIDENPTAANPTPQDLFLHSDHLHSTSVVTDEAGAPVDFPHYLPFGSAGDPAQEHATPYLFAGKELDAETDLYFLGSRYYAPWLCRFTTPDELGRDLNDPQSLNRFVYSRNNPLRYEDPSGHFFVEAILGYFLYTESERVQDFVAQTERHFLRPITHDPGRYLRDHRQELRDAATAAGIAVAGALIVPSGGASAVLAAALTASTTSLVLGTPGGQKAVGELAQGFQKIGVSPRVSYVLAGAVSAAVVSSVAGAAFGVDSGVHAQARYVPQGELGAVRQGLETASFSRAGIELNFLRECTLEDLVDLGASAAGFGAPTLGSALADGALRGGLASVGLGLGGVLTNVQLSWSAAATTAIHGALGYRLGRETSEAFRADAPLERQLLEQLFRR